MLTLLRHRSRASTESRSGGWDAFQPSHHASRRVATGRSALRLLVDEVRPTAVLMPCYVAEGVVRPFLLANVPVYFYRLTPSLLPDLDDVSEQLTQAGARPLFVLIHFFGYPAPTRDLRQRLNDVGGLLLEDCAHALVSTTHDGGPIGETADFVLYSLNKFLPVTDGALLLSRRADISLSCGSNSPPPLPAAAIDAYRRHLAFNADLAACGDASQASALLGCTGTAYEEYYRVINADLKPYAPSPESLALERATDFAALAACRRANAALLHEALAETVSMRLVHAHLPHGTAPFAVPVRVPAERRKALVYHLLARGIVASTLVDKWDFVPPESDRYAVERAFLDEHLLLPVSEHIAEDEIRTMVQSLKEAA